MAEPDDTTEAVDLSTPAAIDLSTPEGLRSDWERRLIDLGVDAERAKERSLLKWPKTSGLVEVKAPEPVELLKPKPEPEPVMAEFEPLETLPIPAEQVVPEIPKTDEPIGPVVAVQARPTFVAPEVKELPPVAGVAADHNIEMLHLLRDLERGYRYLRDNEPRDYEDRDFHSVETIIKRHASRQGISIDQMRKQARRQDIPFEHMVEQVSRGKATATDSVDQSRERGELGFLGPEARKVAAIGANNRRKAMERFNKTGNAEDLEQVWGSANIGLIKSERDLPWMGITSEEVVEGAKKGSESHDFALFLAEQLLKNEEVSRLVDKYGTHENGFRHYKDKRAHGYLMQRGLTPGTPEWEAAEPAANLRAYNELAALFTAGAWHGRVIIPTGDLISTPEGREITKADRGIYSPTLEIVGMAKRGGRMVTVVREQGALISVFDVMDAPQSAAVGMIDAGEFSMEAAVRGMEQRRHFLELAIDSEFADRNMATKIAAYAGGGASLIFFPDLLSLAGGVGKVAKLGAASVKTRKGALRSAQLLETIFKAREENNFVKASEAEAALRREFGQSGGVADALDIVDAGVASRMVDEFPDLLDPEFAASLPGTMGQRMISLHASLRKQRLTQKLAEGKSLTFANYKELFSTDLILADMQKMREELVALGAKARLPAARRVIIKEMEGLRKLLKVADDADAALFMRRLGDSLHELFEDSGAWSRRFHGKGNPDSELLKIHALRGPSQDMIDAATGDARAALEALAKQLRTKRQKIHRLMGSIVAKTRDIKDPIPLLDRAIESVMTASEARAAAAEMLRQAILSSHRIIPNPVNPRPGEGELMPLSDYGARFADMIEEAFGLSREEAEVAARITDARARAWASLNGKEIGKWYDTRIAAVRAIEDAGDIPKTALKMAEEQGDSPIFYSRLLAAADTLRDGDIKIDSVLNDLRKAPKGIPKGEIQWTGIELWLQERKATGAKTVTKQDVIQFLESHAIRVDSQVTGEAVEAITRAQRAVSDHVRDNGLVDKMQATGLDSSQLHRLLVDPARLLEFSRIRVQRMAGGAHERLIDLIDQHDELSVVLQTLSKKISAGGTDRTPAEWIHEFMLAGPRGQGSYAWATGGGLAEAFPKVMDEIAVILRQAHDEILALDEDLYRGWTVDAANQAALDLQDAVEEFAAFIELDKRATALSDSDEWAGLIDRSYDLRIAQDANPVAATKWEHYTVPGGEDYTEMTITLPAESRMPQLPSDARVIDRRSPGGAQVSFPHDIDSGAASDPHRRYVAIDGTGNVLGTPASDTATAKRNGRIGLAGFFPESAGHEFLTANQDIAVHVRFKTRIGANGEKVLFIEEIQSDWSQRARQIAKAAGMPSGHTITTAPPKGIMKAMNTRLKDLQAEAQKAHKTPILHQRQAAMTAYGKNAQKLKDDINGELSKLGYNVEVDLQYNLGRTYVTIKQAAPPQVGLGVIPPHLLNLDEYTMGPSQPHMRTQGLGPNPAEFLIAKMREIHNEKAVGINTGHFTPDQFPPTPFKDDWHKLMVKRVMRYAADNDFDSVAISRPEHITPLMVAQGFSGPPHATDRRWWEGKFQQLTPDEYDAELRLWQQRNPYASLDEAEDFERSLRGRPQPPDEDNLKIYNGIKDFYEGTLPNYMKKYLRQWGGKQREMVVDISDAGTYHRAIDVDAEQARAYGSDWLTGRGPDSRPLSAAKIEELREQQRAYSVIAFDITDDMRTGLKRPAPLLQVTGKDPVYYSKLTSVAENMPKRMAVDDLMGFLGRQPNPKAGQPMVYPRNVVSKETGEIRFQKGDKVLDKSGRQIMEPEHLYTKGVKEEEIKWTNVEEFLTDARAQGKTHINRQDFLVHLMRNRTVVDSYKMGGSSPLRDAIEAEKAGVWTKLSKIMDDSEIEWDPTDYHVVSADPGRLIRDSRRALTGRSQGFLDFFSRPGGDPRAGGLHEEALLQQIPELTDLIRRLQKDFDVNALEWSPEARLPLIDAITEKLKVIVDGPGVNPRLLQKGRDEMQAIIDNPAHGIRKATDDEELVDLADSTMGAPRGLNVFRYEDDAYFIDVSDTAVERWTMTPGPDGETPMWMVEAVDEMADARRAYLRDVQSQILDSKGVALEGSGEPILREIRDLAHLAEIHTEALRINRTPEFREFTHLVEESRKAEVDINPTQYSTWKLEGGHGYREVLIKTPRPQVPSTDFLTWHKAWGSPIDFDKLTSSQQGTMMRRYRSQTSHSPYVYGDGYEGAHWDELNVLVHYRATTRFEVPGVDPHGGRRVLFIEEIQSDWHQQGRARGYSQAEHNLIIERLLEGQERIGAEQIAGPTATRAAELRTEQARLRQKLAEVRHKGPVPDGPFKDTKTWTDLAIKHIFRQAADEGYDGVAFTRSDLTSDYVSMPRDAAQAYYDGTVLSRAKRHTKVSPESIRIAGGASGTEFVPYFALTEKARTRVQKPQVMYQRAGVPTAAKPQTGWKFRELGDGSVELTSAEIRAGRAAGEAPAAAAAKVVPPPAGFLEGSVYKDDLFVGADDLVGTGHSLLPNLGGEYGIYLTPRRRYAQRYGDNLLRVKVSLKNPKYVADKNEISPRDLTKSDIDLLIEQGHDGIVVTNKGIGEASEVVLFQPEQAWVYRISDTPGGPAAKITPVKTVETIGQDKITSSLFSLPGGQIKVAENSPGAGGAHSVVVFVVDKSERGQGMGSQLVGEVLRAYPDKEISAQVSSLASLKVFHNKGFRHQGMDMEFGDLAKLYKDEGGSLNMRHAPEAPAVAIRTMGDIPLGPERDAILKAGIKAQDGGADVFEKFLLDTFGTTQGHEGWTLQLQTLRRRELITGPPVSQVTNPDGSIVYRAYHGTYRGLPEAEVKAFGGVHAGTERAARDRLADTRASSGMGPYGPKEGTVVPVELRLSRPYGSFDSPISEHELSQLVNIRGKMEALKAQGYDGVIYRNVVEDKGEISVLSFQAKNVVKTPRAPRAPEAPAEVFGAGLTFQMERAGRVGRKNTMRIKTSELPEALQGRGMGSELYLRALQHAKDKGFRVTSDVNPSPEAMSVYNKLQEAGVPIRRELSDVEGVEMLEFVIEADQLKNVNFDLVAETLMKQRLDKTKLGLYSGLRLAATKLPDKVQTEAVLTLLRKQGGIKADELKWVGVPGWLESMKAAGRKSLTRREIVQFMDENAVHLTVTRLSRQTTAEIPPHLRKALDDAEKAADAAWAPYEASLRAVGFSGGDIHLTKAADPRVESGLANSARTLIHQMQSWADQTRTFGIRNRPGITRVQRQLIDDIHDLASGSIRNNLLDEAHLSDMIKRVGALDARMGEVGWAQPGPVDDIMEEAVLTMHQLRAMRTDEARLHRTFVVQRQTAERNVSQATAVERPKWKTETIDGQTRGDDIPPYEEILIKHPFVADTTGWKTKQMTDGDWHVIESSVYPGATTTTPRALPSLFGAKTPDEAISKLKHWIETDPHPFVEELRGAYKRGHWGRRNENVLAHVRLTERIDADGNRVLFVEEIQSDWHQAGRAAGYKLRPEDETSLRSLVQKLEASLGTTASQEDAAKAADQINKMFYKMGGSRHVRVAARGFAIQADGSLRPIFRVGSRRATARLGPDGPEITWIEAAGMSFTAAIDDLISDAADVGVKAAPFSKNWYELAIKQVLRKAADEGYHSVAFNKGDVVQSVVGGGIDGQRYFYDEMVPKFLGDYAQKQWGTPLQRIKLNWADDVEMDRLRSISGSDLQTEAARRNTGATLQRYRDLNADEGVVGIRISDEMRGSINAGQTMFQGEEGVIKGAVQFAEDGKATIFALKQGDISTVVHELGHIFRRDLGAVDLRVTEKWAGVVDGQWTVEAEEKFARAFERYLREGEAPNVGLRTVFEKLKVWLAEIYRNVAGTPIDVELTDEVRQVFKNLLSEQPPNRPPLKRISRYIDRELFGPPGDEGVNALEQLAAEALRVGATDSTAVDMLGPMMASLARNDVIHFNRPVLGKTTWTKEDLAKLQSTVEAESVAARRAKPPSIPLRSMSEAIAEETPDQKIRSAFNVALDKKHRDPGDYAIAGIAALARASVATVLGGDEFAALRHLPPAVRHSVLAGTRTVEQAYGDMIRLVGEGDVNAATRFLGGETVKFKNGRDALSSGFDATGAVMQDMKRWTTSAMSPKHRDALIRLARNINEAPAGRSGVGIELSADKDSAEAIEWFFGNASGADAAPRFLKQIREALEIPDQIRPSHEMRLIEVFLHHAGVTERAGEFSDARGVDMAKALIDDIEKIYGKEDALRIAVLFAGYGQAVKAKQRWAGLGMAIGKADFDAYHAWLNGMAIDKDMQPKMRAIASRFGMNPNFISDAALDVDMYIPAAARSRMAAALARGSQQVQVSGKLGEQFYEDKMRGAWRGMYQYLKTRMTRGGFFVRQRYFLMNTIDHFTQMAISTGFRPAFASTIRMTTQNFMVLPGVAHAARLAEAVGIEKASERMRQVLQSGGDRMANAVGEMMGMSKYRIEVNPILEGIDGTFTVTDAAGRSKIYKHRDIRDIAVEEGIFASFDTRALERSIKRAVNLQSDDLIEVAKGGRLEQAASNTKRITRELTDIVSETAEAWSERERLGAMITLMESGMAPRDAARMAIDALYDYAGSMSKVDRHVLVNLMFPFWAFQKNANRQILNAMFSPAGAYRMGVMRRAQEGATEALTELLYDRVSDPYGVDWESMPKELQDNYWALRQSIEYGYGPLEALRAAPGGDELVADLLHAAGAKSIGELSKKERHFLENGFGGPSRVPPDVRNAIRAYFSGVQHGLADEFGDKRSPGGAVSIDRALANYMHRMMPVSESAGRRESIADYYNPKPHPSARRSYTRDKHGVAITPRMHDDVRKFRQLVPNDHVYLEMYVPDSTINAGFRHAASSYALQYLTVRGFIMAGREDSAVTLSGLQNNLETLGDPFGAPVPAAMAETLTGEGARPRRVHPAIGKFLDHAVPFITIGKVPGIKDPWATDDERERDRRLAEAQKVAKDPRIPIEDVGVFERDRYYVSPGIPALMFSIGPWGELNDQMLAWERSPVEESIREAWMLRWARGVIGLQTGVVSRKKSARGEMPRFLKKSSAPPRPTGG